MGLQEILLDIWPKAHVKNNEASQKSTAVFYTLLGIFPGKMVRRPRNWWQSKNAEDFIF